MGIVIANGECLVAHEITLSGAPHPFIVTYGVDNDTALSADSIATLCRVAFNAQLFAPGGAVDAGTGWVSRQTKTLSRTAGGLLEAGLSDVPLAGTGTNTSPPANSSILITKRTGLAGRRYRGRMFLPCFGMAEAAVDAAGLLSGATVTAWNTRAGAFRTALSGVSLPLVLQHSDGAAGTPISSLVVSALVGTQRGRIR